jgi:hypothetical protein
MLNKAIQTIFLDSSTYYAHTCKCSRKWMERKVRSSICLKGKGLRTQITTTPMTKRYSTMKLHRTCSKGNQGKFDGVGHVWSVRLPDLWTKKVISEEGNWKGTRIGNILLYLEKYKKYVTGLGVWLKWYSKLKALSSQSRTAKKKRVYVAKFYFQKRVSQAWRGKSHD